MEVVNTLRIVDQDLTQLVTRLHQYRNVGDNCADLQWELNGIKQEVRGLILAGFELGKGEVHDI